MYFSIMPFLHVSSHDNTVALPSTCCTDTSGIPGTVANKASMDTCKLATSPKRKEKKIEAEKSNVTVAASFASFQVYPTYPTLVT